MARRDGAAHAQAVSSTSRVFAVLGLFTAARPHWHVDEIHRQLGYARATGYRYVRELVAAGLLQKVGAGRYALGARIIELDYQLRQTDPVLLAAAPCMARLAKASGLDAVLTTLFAGPRVVDTHRVCADGTLALRYGRGRPRPLFLGAAPKVLLAHLPRPALARLHAAHAAEIAGHGLGGDWPAFRDRLAAIRERGAHVSYGELEAGIAAAAVPLAGADGDVVAALALVGRSARLRRAGETEVLQTLRRSAQAIGRALMRVSSGSAAR